ncbi:MAG: hypothetical protein HGA65_03380 [Oscillochloris sp.]|nr:hypothetical protein [Oscillochloris sp.]
MSTLELIADLAIAMVCNDMPSVRRTLDALDSRMPPEKIGALLSNLDHLRAPTQVSYTQPRKVHAA